jgi:hypothetical protein
MAPTVCIMNAALGRLVDDAANDSYFLIASKTEAVTMQIAGCLFEHFKSLTRRLRPVLNFAPRGKL